MTAREWFQAYTDALSTAHYLMQYSRAQGDESRAFWSRTMLAYRSAKGLEYADSVAVQTDALLEGVEALRNGVVT